VIVGALTLVFALFGVWFFVIAVRRARKRRYRACAAHGVSSLVSFLLATVLALIAVNLMTYERLTREQPAADLRFARLGDAKYRASLVYPDGATQALDLAGDEWQIDARVLKWKGLVNLLGFDTGYRLERISGRYSDIEREKTAPRTVYALNPPARVDVWTLSRRYHDYLPWVDALYGSATFVPMADGALYRVYVSQSGLIARPQNDAARQAVGGWK
jgi:hypothetical protein